MKTIVIIPARYDSQRFPGKILSPIKGHPMIKHVIEGVSGSSLVEKVVVATDSEKIASYVSRINTEVVMTSDRHQSGTERILEAIENITDKWDILINVQGDEPLISSTELDLLIERLHKGDCDISTLVRPLHSIKVAKSPHNVKVTFDKSQIAHYFSRSLIPYPRNEVDTWYQHIGLYGFKKATIMKIKAMSESPLERSEGLEQLRWIDNDLKIGICKTNSELIGVDVPEDIKAVEKVLSGKE